MKFHALVIGLLLALPAAAQDSRDTAFLTARDAFRAGDRNKLERASSQIGNHELAVYAENYRLRMNFDQGDSAAIRSQTQNASRNETGAGTVRADGEAAIGAVLMTLPPWRGRPWAGAKPSRGFPPSHRGTSDRVHHRSAFRH